MPRDYYNVLGLDRAASPQEVKKAFRLLARELHPDVNAHDPEAEEKFKEAAEAYEVLSDAEQRRIYDTHGHEGLRSGGFAPRAAGFGSIEDIFDSFFGSAGPFGEAGGSGAFGFGRRGPAGGGDVGVAVEIALEEVLSGAKREVSFDAVDVCDQCRGNGAEPGTPISSCDRCDGSGQLRQVTQTPFGQMVRAVACDRCGGGGRIAETPCRECAGRGRKARAKTFEVEVPPGIESGQRVRISGAGHAGEPGGRSGDLYVEVRVATDERFERDGDDLVTVIDLAATRAMLGARIDVATVEGERQIEIPPGTQPGTQIRLRGLGLPRLGSARRGDQRLIVNVIVPASLSDEQRRLAGDLDETIGERNLKAGRGEGIFSRVRRAFG